MEKICKFELVGGRTLGRQRSDTFALPQFSGVKRRLSLYDIHHGRNVCIESVG
jgi:hypothetical protein